jgi:hypothetical protein
MAFGVLHQIYQCIVGSNANETAISGDDTGDLKGEHAHEHDGIIRPEELLSQAKPASQRNGNKRKDREHYR